MRIIGGRHKGRLFKALRGSRTHPMSEKVRAALFSVLGELEGLSVYDAYGGSGALGFEAVSRGASKVQITELDRRAYNMIRKNLDKLGFSEVRATRANCASWAANNEDLEFDVVLADPPYDAFDRRNLEKLTLVLKQGGIFVVSYPKFERTPDLKGLELIDDKNYGDAKLAFYKKV